MKLNYTKFLIILLVMFSLAFSGCKVKEETKIVKGPVMDKVTFKLFSPVEAKEKILTGELDYYLSSLEPNQAITLKDNPSVKFHSAYSQFMGISLNPAPAKDGSLNPFSVKEVRFALNYLIDRDEIVKTVYSGYAVPVVVDMISKHPSYDVIKPIVEYFDIKYDKEKAISMIDLAMIKSGAIKVNGVWNYKNRTIVLSVPIDNQDKESLIMAGIVSDKLKEAGFEIEEVYYDRSDEDYLAPMYSTDPADVKWHFYVTGWIFYSASKYQENGFPELIEKEGYWKYENLEIKNITDALTKTSGLKEWEELNRRLTKLQIEDSVGVWFVAKENIFPVRSEVEDLTKDDFIGLRSYLNIRKASARGKNELIVGEKYLYEKGDSWNPVVIESISMMDVVNSIHDPAILTNPKTLEKEPFRWGYSIESFNNNIPKDAFIFDVTNNEWILVNNSVNAKTKVTYDLSKYIKTKWHHGEEITWSDILFFLASSWDRSFDKEKQKISDSRWQERFSEIKGLRINSNMLEVYSDNAGFNEENILNLAGLFQRIAPWEIYAAMDNVVFLGKTFEYGEVSDIKLKKLSLVNKEHALTVLDALDSLDYANVSRYTSIGANNFLSEQEFLGRKLALHDWFSIHSHLIVSDGPFYLDRYNEEDGSIELRAFRDESYPFSYALN